MSAVLKSAEAIVRPMREADLSQVIEVEQGAYEFPWSPGIFRDCLRVGYCCWVIERNAQIDGYCVMQMGAGESHVLNLCVRVNAQGQGLGRTLLTRIIDVARDRGADTVLLEVSPTNTIARSLYPDMGFNEVGVRRAYYPGRQGREDALILARTLA